MNIQIAGNPLASRPDDDSVVILAKTEYYSLDGVGRYVWDRLEEGPQEVASLVSSVADSFEVSPQQAQADLVALVKDLKSAGLVVTVDS